MFEQAIPSISYQDGDFGVNIPKVGFASLEDEIVYAIIAHAEKNINLSKRRSDYVQLSDLIESFPQLLPAKKYEQNLLKVPKPEKLVYKEEFTPYDIAKMNRGIDPLKGPPLTSSFYDAFWKLTNSWRILLNKKNGKYRVAVPYVSVPR